MVDGAQPHGRCLPWPDCGGWIKALKAPVNKLHVAGLLDSTPNAYFERIFETRVDLTGCRFQSRLQIRVCVLGFRTKGQTIQDLMDLIWLSLTRI